MSGERDVRLRRVYDQPSPDDGQRLLVDRLWPRGLSKAAAHVDEWVKAVAPSDDLRRWYGHDPARFTEFRHRYGEELREPERAAALAHLGDAARRGTITLLTATKDADRSQAAVLAELLRAAEACGARAEGARAEGARAEGARAGDPRAGDPRAEGAPAGDPRAGGAAGVEAEGRPWGDDRPGDPVCWMNRVCPACGTLAGADPPTTCAHCHAAIPVP